MLQIIRIWHRWTSFDNASAYEKLLKTEVFDGIFDNKLSGFNGIELAQKRVAEEVAFVTVMWFASIEHIKAFAGEAYETAYVPPAARAIFKRIDPLAKHYRVLETLPNA